MIVLREYQESEIWRVIKKYPGYEISNYGRVKSKPRIVNHGRGQIKRNIRGRELKPTIGTHGYKYISLSHNGWVIKRTIHSLVLENFTTKPCEGLECMHLDGNRLNNYIGNLRWGTPTCNQAFRFDDGTACVGENHPLNKLTEKDVLAICQKIDDGITQEKIASEYPVRRQTISKIKTGRLWGRLTGKGELWN